MRFMGLALPFLCALACHASDEDSLIALRTRAIAAMRRALAAMPNYVCTEKGIRSIAAGNPPRTSILERFRLDVTFLQGRELFAWPDAASFELDDPRDLFGDGLTGTGSFGSFSRTVFDGDAAQFTTFGEEDRHSRKTVKYDYRVPLARSGYQLRSAVHNVTVAYRGAFWVDAATGRILALEVRSGPEDVPVLLDMSDVKLLIEYRYIDIAGRELPFPAVSTLTVASRWSSKVSTNRTEFTGCREYSATSNIQFGVEGGPLQAPTPAGPAELPGGVTLELMLDTPIRSASAVAGDTVRARVLRPTRAGGLTVPRGAQLTGRIYRVQTDLESERTYVRIGFSRLEWAGIAVPFRARFLTFRYRPGQEEWLERHPLAREESDAWTSHAHFTLIGKKARLGKGTRFLWITQGARPAGS